ncbi:MAG: minor capsid protein [Clostridia bacterium]|nr:minor capsid protein [Clostridia bacterium]
MQIRVTSEVRIDVSRIVGAVNNDRFWTFAASEWHRLYTPYVPMDTGTMSQQVVIQPKTIIHTAPYAHYQYAGAVYGPSFPIVQGGVAVGFFSPRGKAKRPTGASLSYRKSRHPLASAQWDKAAIPAQMPLLIRSLQAYVDGGGLNLGG